MSDGKPMYFLFCKLCDELVGEGQQCECGEVTKKNSKKNNFLVYFPLLPQIHNVLRENFEMIMEYLQRERASDSLSDIDDGKLYKKLYETNKVDEFLTLTMNIDGASIFKSVSGSMWPVQFYLNFLPPAIRYLAKNIIVTTIFYGNHKPDISKLIFPLAKELDNNQHQISVQTSDNLIVNFRLCILLISCDLPARAALQNFIGPNGKFGCLYCHHTGVPITNLSGKSKTIRFIKLSEEIKLRTHCETVKSSIALKETPMNGVKGISAALMLSDIDIIHSFPIDFMHGIALGVMKELIEIWLGKKRLSNPPYPYFKLKPNQREILKNRILDLKPPLTWHRKPRSILEVANFKASELLTFMWFYLRYTLPGLLPTKIIKHFELLSAAVYILCQDTIKPTEQKMACDMLNNFADEFENIYGKGAITMNIHLLRHYFQMITNCGPLWSYSLFGFENNIGSLKKLVHGNTDVLEQISKKYFISNKKVSTYTTPVRIYLKERDTAEISEEIIAILSKTGTQLLNPLIIWKRLIFYDEVFTSTRSNQERCCDSFVKLKNGQIGIIQFYFKLENKEALLLKSYKEESKNYHWTEVLPTNGYEVHLCSDIFEKPLYFKAFAAEYITSMPNRYIRAFC